MITAYFDGACEPVNPGGWASFGAVVYKDDSELWTCSKLFVPIKGREKETSNNVAEYSGFLSILEFLKEQELQKDKIQIYGDSNLVICQMFGDVKRHGKLWKMKKGFYIPIAMKAKILLKEFSDIKGSWIPREQNGVADKLSKAELLKAGVEFRIQPE